MVYYSTKNILLLDFIDKFCNNIGSKKENILTVKKFGENNADIFFIPVYGEEELNFEWEIFLKKYADNINNVNKNTFFYLYGVYELELNKNSTIIKQVYKILEFLSLQINIFPLKIMLDYVPVESLVYHYNHTYKKNKDNSLIEELIFFSKQKLLQNDLQKINFTAKSDEYSSIIDSLKIKRKKDYLIKLLSSIKSKNVILNRVKSINMNKILSKTENNNIQNLQLKSNNLNKIKFLKGFKSLEYLNLTANLFDFVNMDKLPPKIVSFNSAKNKIKEVKITKKRLKIKKLILFNNKIENMNFLNNFPNLEYLNIGLNPIEKFPEAIFELKNLKHLNISYLNIDFLPENILNLKKLETIDISSTKIVNFNDIISLLQNNVEVIY